MEMKGTRISNQIFDRVHSTSPLAAKPNFFYPNRKVTVFFSV